MSTTLHIEANRLVLQWDGLMAETPLSAVDLEAQFTLYPPTKITWENAIVQIEDTILPSIYMRGKYRLRPFKVVTVKPYGFCWVSVSKPTPWESSGPKTMTLFCTQYTIRTGNF